MGNEYFVLIKDLKDNRNISLIIEADDGSACMLKALEVAKETLGHEEGSINMINKL